MNQINVKMEYNLLIIISRLKINLKWSFSKLLESERKNNHINFKVEQFMKENG